jgi:hypothetical protein
MTRRRSPTFLFPTTTGGEFAWVPKNAPRLSIGPFVLFFLSLRRIAFFVGGPRPVSFFFFFKFIAK